MDEAITEEPSGSFVNHLTYYSPLLNLGNSAKQLPNTSTMEAIEVFTRSMTIAEFKKEMGIDGIKAIKPGSGKPFFRMYKDGEPVLDPQDATKQLGGRCSDNGYELAVDGKADQLEVCWFTPDGGEPSWMLKSKDSAKGVML